MTVSPAAPWKARLQQYFESLGWFAGRHVDLTSLLAQRARQGWTPFPAVVTLLEQVEGLGNPDSAYFSAACGPKFHQEVRPLERLIGSRLFPIGAEDGWMAFLMDEQGRCYACDLPYEATAFASLEDLAYGNGTVLTLRKPSPDLAEYFDLSFTIVQYRHGGCPADDPAYQAMSHRRQILELQIYRWNHPLTEFKTPFVRPY